VPASTGDEVTAAADGDGTGDKTVNGTYFSNYEIVYVS
jgi:hypothetical protein